MEAGKVKELRQFINLCKSNPGLLQDPSFSFFVDFVRSLGGDIALENYPGVKNAGKNHHDKSDDEIIESDIELDEPSVEPDNDPPQQMGDPSIEVSDENREAAQLSKAKAMDALSEDRLEEAAQHLTEAIVLNPSSAILYATRASIFHKMNKPNAAIRDAEAALQINPDSAKGYKYRGSARAALGQWEEAAKDLHLASNLDHDQEIAEALKKVEPNAHKIEEHKRKYIRLRKERELKKSQEELRRHQAKKEDSGPSSPISEGRGKVVGVHSAAEMEDKMRAAAARLTVIYFTATWCGPCRLMGPVYTGLAAEYPSVMFLKVDIDELAEVAQRWAVTGVPAFFLLKDGKEVDRLVGADKVGLEKKVALLAGK
ncbi:tetraticopeptide domain-containing thioredoxin [Wolffia australiana]